MNVTIRHPNRGDLVIYLVSPEGTKYYRLKSSSSDTADDIVKTYTVNASSAFAGGLWTLRVDDVRAGNAGFIEQWTLTRSVTSHSRTAPPNAL